MACRESGRRRRCEGLWLVGGGWEELEGGEAGGGVEGVGEGGAEGEAGVGGGVVAEEVDFPADGWRGWGWGDGGEGDGDGEAPDFRGLVDGDGGGHAAVPCEVFFVRGDGEVEPAAVG